MDTGFQQPSPDTIARDWQEFTGGPPVVGLLRNYDPAAVEGLLWRDAREGLSGLVTWWVQGDAAEIVSLHAVPQGRGTGARLMEAAEAELRRRGVRRVLLATTNDNVRALAFYIRAGYRLVRVHLDAMERVRRLKPHLPETGHGGVPLQDLWELQKTL